MENKLKDTTQKTMGELTKSLMKLQKEYAESSVSNVLAGFVVGQLSLVWNELHKLRELINEKLR